MIKNKTLSCLLFVIYKALKIALQFLQSIRNFLSLPSVFSMSKLLRKHVANWWNNSWDMLEAKNIIF